MDELLRRRAARDGPPRQGAGARALAEDTPVVEFRLEAKAPNLDTTIGKDSGEGKKSSIVHFDARRAGRSPATRHRR
jgi:hypothetical protein